jgi:hypothetical protein
MVWKSPLSAQVPAADTPEGSPEIPVPPPETPPQPAPHAQQSTGVKSGPAPGTRTARKKGLKASSVRGGAPPAAAAAPARTASVPVSRPSEEPVTAWRRTRWILLAFVPSSLMLGVIEYISTDLSPFPLIWMVPLALYLLSFILVFMRWPIPWTSSETGTTTPHSIVLIVAQPLSILALCWILLSGGFAISYMYIAWAAFFCTALACHGEMARDRPDPKHLTEFFLLMSVGGALGGFFNAIIAPIFFAGVWEFYITLALACFVRPILAEAGWLDTFLMNQFPGLQSWARDQSDQFSRSMGKQPDGSTYVFSYLIDILLGVFIIALVAFLNWQSTSESGLAYTPDRAEALLKFIGFPADKPAHIPGGYAHYYRIQAFMAVIYGLPLVLCGLFSSRALRFGLGVTFLLCMDLWWSPNPFLRGREDETLARTRTYFGVLRVLEGTDQIGRRVRQGNDIVWAPVFPNDPAYMEEYNNFTQPKNKDQEAQHEYKFTYLMHGTTYHGRNYEYRRDKEGNPIDLVDLSRLATTYYHRYGPVGVVMEKFNWAPGPQNTYWADARMPATMVALGAVSPWAQIVNTWSEPPYATIGLGTGTMASYARPYQHMTYYEIDSQIREFSLPPKGHRAYFTYLIGAMKRGVNLEIIMGDAFQSMKNEDSSVALYPYFPRDLRLGNDDGDGENPLLKQSTMGTFTIKERSPREHYYHAINVDAFSSDAIPVHLITVEALKMYLDKLSYDGCLCVHTSNRHLDLVQVVAKNVDVLNERYYQNKEYLNSDPALKQYLRVDPRTKEARDWRLMAMVGKEQADREQYLGLFSSEYVMLYFGSKRDDQNLKPARDYVPPQYNIYDGRSRVDWRPPEKAAANPWTLDFSNVWKILR